MIKRSSFEIAYTFYGIKNIIYRKEIDGLRAIAVLPVIFFHAGFCWFKGGFVGVDIFFVISGYLITSIIYKEIINEKFSLINFYERRARRILPALFFVIIACAPFAWVWMLPNEFTKFSESIIAVNLISSNIYFWKNTTYFAPASELVPLLHTWSLSIEEQFYVFFPLFLLIFGKIRLPILLSIVTILVILSLLLSEWGSNTHPSANFYLLPTRAWELGIGAILALTSRYWSGLNIRGSNVLSIAGFLMIISSILVFDDKTPFPSFWAIIPTLGTALVIAFANRQTIVGNFLSFRPLVGIGLISYSAYLWHWPIFSFARIRSFQEPSTDFFILLSCTTVIIAYFSWRFVERPFRNKEAFSRQRIFSLSVIFFITFTLSGLLGYWTQGVPSRMHPNVIKMANNNIMNEDYRRCRSSVDKTIKPENSCVYGVNDKSRIALLGDSHAGTLATQLADSLTKFNTNLRGFYYDSCMPTLGVSDRGIEDGCVEYNNSVFKHITSSLDIDTVVFVARWPVYLEGTRFDNQEGGVEFGGTSYILPIGNKTDYTDNAKRIKALGEYIRSTIEKYVQSGKKVVIVYPIPEVGWHVPNRLAKQLLHEKKTSKISTSYDIYKKRITSFDREIKKLGDMQSVISVRPETVFCNTEKNFRCLATKNHEPLYFDDDHLNDAGASMLSDLIANTMNVRGWLKY